MINHKYILSFILFALLLASCDEPKKKTVVIDKSRLKETLVKVNKKYLDVENTQIDDFMRRRAWNDFEKSKSGLRYKIYKKGVGKTPVAGSIISIEYSIIDIKGNKLYDSEKLGRKEFEVDKNEEPSGLNEAVKLMKLGAKAKLIIPSYLAYGLIGDENKIGQKATLIYDIHLVEVN